MSTNLRQTAYVLFLILAAACSALGQTAPRDNDRKAVEQAATATPPDLDKVEAALKTTPDDPILNYRKCQALFAKGKEQEAIDHAAVALAKFKAAKNDLVWMLLGSFTSNNFKIDVHYNMGASERAEKREGIVRPYSFRVWSTDAEPQLVRTLDFELAYFEGKVISAAVGEMRGRGHANYGIVKPDSDFATIKKKISEIVAR